MSSIAILDFDGVIAEVTEHAQKARELAYAFALTQDPDPTSRSYREAVKAFFYSERGFYDEKLLDQDQPVAGCEQALKHLVQEYDRVVVLTSRPHFLREATLRWFSRCCPGFEEMEFIFKESDEQTIRGEVWKAQIVAHFAEDYHIILFIDDYERNRKEIETMANNLRGVKFLVKSCFAEYFSSEDVWKITQRRE